MVEVKGEIVGKRPRELLVLELHEDGAGFGLADPNGQVAVFVLDLENNYRARAEKIQVDPID
jgi:hypothetical protein